MTRASVGFSEAFMVGIAQVKMSMSGVVVDSMLGVGCFGLGSEPVHDELRWFTEHRLAEKSTLVPMMNTAFNAQTRSVLK